MKVCLIRLPFTLLFARTLLLSVGILIAMFVCCNASATIYYWDPNSASPAVGGSGTWDATSSLWRSTTTSGILGTWPNTSPNSDTANLGTLAGTVTLNTSSANINFNNITFGIASTIIAPPGSGTATLVASGTTPTFSMGNFGCTVNAVISGTSGFTVTGTSSSALLTVGGANTYSGPAIINGSAELILNNNLGLGSGSGGVQLFPNLGTAGNGYFVVKSGLIIANNVVTFNTGGSGTPSIQGTASAGATTYFDGNMIENSGSGNTVQFQANTANGLFVIGGSSSRTINVQSGNLSSRGSGMSFINSTISGTLTQFGRSSSEDCQVYLNNNNNSFVTTANPGIDFTRGTLYLTSIANQGVNCSLGAGANTGTQNIRLGNGTTVAPAIVFLGSAAQTCNRILQLAGTTFGATLDQSGSGSVEFTSDFLTTGVGAKTLVLAGSTSGTGQIDGKIVDSSSGATTLAKTGSGTWTLTGQPTYSGATIITNGTLALGASATINNSASLSIMPGATFDVSAISSYTLSSSTTLSASGAGGWPAVIKGNSSGAVSLGSQAITLTYDGSNPALNISQGPLTLAGQTITVNTPKPLVNGTYTIVSITGGTVNHTGSFTLAGTAGTGTIGFSGGNVQMTITGSSVVNSTTTTLSANETKTYGTTSTFVATVTGATASSGTVQFYVDGAAFGSAVALSGTTATIPSTTTAATAGTHAICAVYSGDSTHAPSSATTASSLTVSAKTLTITSPTVFAKPYDGTTAAIITGTLSGTVSGDTLMLNGSGGTFASSGVGTGIGVTANCTILAAPVAGQSAIPKIKSYSLTQPSSLTANITTANPTVTPTVGTYTYNTSAQGPNSVIFSSLTDSGTVTYSYVGTGSTSYGPSSTAPTSAGTYTVTASVAADANNSAVSSAATAFTIAKATPTLSVGNSPQTYTGSAQAATVNASVAGTVSSILTGGASAQTAAGTYAVTASFTPTDTTDYNSLTAASAGNFVINKATPTVTPTVGTYTYNGSAQGPNSVTTSPVSTGTETYSYAGIGGTTYGPSSTQPTLAGTYAVTATVGADANNNSGSSSATAFTINQASTFVGASSTKNPSGYTDSVAYNATLPTDATGSVVFSSTNAAFSTNTVSSGSATSSALTTLPRGTNLVIVAYLGDGNYLGSTNSLNQVVTNHPPVAADATYYRAKGLSLKIAITNLLTNVTDADGDTISLQSVGAGLTNATIMTDSTYVYYLPTTGGGSNDNDAVSYTVSDGFGGTATANILIDVYSATGSAQMNLPTNGVVNITFFGIPNYTYIVQTTTNLSVPWWTLSTNTAGTNGVWQFTDPNATNAQQYYRSAQP